MSSRALKSLAAVLEDRSLPTLVRSGGICGGLWSSQQLHQCFAHPVAYEPVGLGVAAPVVANGTGETGPSRKKLQDSMDLVFFLNSSSLAGHDHDSAIDLLAPRDFMDPRECPVLFLHPSAGTGSWEHGRTQRCYSPCPKLWKRRPVMLGYILRRVGECSPSSLRYFRESMGSSSRSL